MMVRSKTGSSVRLSHRHEAFLGGLTASEDGLLFYGTINFHGNIGYSSFQVRVGGVPEFDFRVEVFPSKLESKDDYGAISGDVHRQMMGLALEYHHGGVNIVGPNEPDDARGHHVRGRGECWGGYAGGVPRFSNANLPEWQNVPFGRALFGA